MIEVDMTELMEMGVGTKFIDEITDKVPYTLTRIENGRAYADSLVNEREIFLPPQYTVFVKKMSAECIVKMLIGGGDKPCAAIMIDDDWVGYLEEIESGYEDHDSPVLAAVGRGDSDSDEAFLLITMNDLKSAIITETSVVVRNDYGVSTLTPLVRMTFTEEEQCPLKM